MECVILINVLLVIQLRCQLEAFLMCSLSCWERKNGFCVNWSTKIRFLSLSSVHSGLSTLRPVFDCTLTPLLSAFSFLLSPRKVDLSLHHRREAWYVMGIKTVAYSRLFAYPPVMASILFFFFFCARVHCSLLVLGVNPHKSALGSGSSLRAFKREHQTSHLRVM